MQAPAGGGGDADRWTGDVGNDNDDDSDGGGGCDFGGDFGGPEDDLDAAKDDVRNINSVKGCGMAVR